VGDEEMTSGLETRIYRLAAICLLLVLASVVGPRFMSSGDGGIAAASNAIMVFLAILVLAAGLSAYLFFLTLPYYRALPVSARIAGLGPAILIVGGLAWLVLFLRY